LRGDRAGTKKEQGRKGRNKEKREGKSIKLLKQLKNGMRRDLAVLRERIRAEKNSTGKTESGPSDSDGHLLNARRGEKAIKPQLVAKHQS